jgi:hypothetical protein
MNCQTRLLITLFISMLFFGCREKTDKSGLPVGISADSLIQPGKMALVLADVHVVEAAFLNDRNEGLNSNETPGYYYEEIFKKHHVSRERYEQSLTYYRHNPERYSKIYEKVVAVLEARQKKIILPK